jgi:competence protein ComEC
MEQQFTHEAERPETLATRLAERRAALISLLIEERMQWLLWLPVALGLGIWGYFALPYEPQTYAGVTAFTLLVFLTYSMRRNILLRTCLLAAALIAMGFTAAQVERHLTDTTVLQKPTRILSIQAEIADIIDMDGRMKLLLEQPQDTGEGRRTHLPKKIRISLKRPDNRLQVGQKIQLRAGLFPLPGPALPEGFDFSRHFYFQGIGAVGFGIAPVTILETAELEGLARKLSKLRLGLARHIRDRVDDHYAGPVAAALITGDRAAIAAEVKDAMRGAGLAHMLAISGLHLGLVAGILFFLARALLLLHPAITLHYSIKKWAAGIALLGSFIYLALAGFPVSAQRAYVMVALLLGAVMLDRRVMPLRSLALAAILILLWSPSQLLSPSFQLSFAATIAILSMIELYRQRHKPTVERQSLLYKPVQFFGGILMTSLAASIATAPFIIFHFNQFTLWDVLGNLGASAILSLWVMPCAVMSMLLMPLGLDSLLLPLMAWGIEYILAIAFWVSNLPHALSYVPTLPDWSMALIILGGCWLCFWQTRWRLAGLPLIVIGSSGLLFLSLPDVIISEKAEQIAIRLPGEIEGYSMVRGSSRNFTANIWQEALGIDHWQPPEKLETFRCDGLGCHLQLGTHSVAMPLYPSAMAEDCGSADIIIAPFYHDCRAATHSIERPRNPISIWLEEDRITLQHAQPFVERLHHTKN